jgi:NAD(P)-dependent dehydrogenase (short-subunit alcohol dehydrogenase family)
VERFADKVVLVTGGSSGIGAATARRLAAEGAEVVIAARHTDRGKATAAAITDEGGRASFVHCDVTVEIDVARMVSTVIEKHGRLDGAFNNAGATAFHGRITEVDGGDWRRELDANLTSVFYCLKYEIAAMTGGGAIVNNASIAAVSGTPGMSAYTAAKHGVLGLTRAAALECVDHNLRINAILTGNVDTPLYRTLSGVGADDALPAAPNPTGRTATPDEIAAFVAYLLSDEATFVTGAGLPIDGGYTAS